MAFQSSKVVNDSGIKSPSIDTPISLTKEDKWKAVSHLQKCIRRGWVDLIEPAVHLCYELDPAYTRYRLSVIAFEDIAGGNPTAIAESFKDGWTKKVIESKGGLDWLVTQALEWARGPKDRLSSDLLACIYHLSDFEKKHGEFSSISVDDALTLAWDESNPWWSRALAFWRASGTEHYPHPLLPKVPGDIEKVIALNDVKGISSKLSDCLRAGKSQRESAPVFLPLVGWGMKQEPSQLNVLDSSKNKPEWIGPWVSIALDKHTREGQQALSWAWFNAGWKKSFEKHQANKELALDAVGRMQFWMEGGLLDKTFDYPLKKQVSLDSRRDVIKSWPFSAKEIYAIAGDDKVWNEARRAIIGVKSLIKIKPL